LPQGPGQLDVGHFRQHVLGRDDALGHQITAGVVDEHVHVTTERLHGHVDGHPFFGGAHDGRVEGLVDVAQPRAGDHDAAVQQPVFVRGEELFDGSSEQNLSPTAANTDATKQASFIRSTVEVDPECLILPII
jgi:hypothetical protein